MVGNMIILPLQSALWWIVHIGIQSVEKLIQDSQMGLGQSANVRMDTSGCQMEIRLVVAK